MAFCSACGQEVGSASFCPKCGASQGPVAVPAGGAAAPAVAAANPANGVQENVAALLCYLPVVGWIIALILFLIDKRSFVKFHAAQALALYVSLIVIYFALGISKADFRLVAPNTVKTEVWGEDKSIPVSAELAFLPPLRSPKPFLVNCIGGRVFKHDKP